LTDRKQVIDPRGISVDSQDGTKTVNLPPGTVLAAPMDPIHRDAAIYPDPDSFLPHRFTQAGAARSIVDQLSSGNGHSNVAQSSTPGKDKSTATLDDAFLGFGFGKHACPGRFFALNEMKIFVAHMVMHYDVEVVGGRPELVDVIWLKVPLNDAKIRVRKRSVQS
jgi:cytochrome P450